jgi:hypothetical protein
VYISGDGEQKLPPGFGLALVNAIENPNRCSVDVALRQYDKYVPKPLYILQMPVEIECARGR